jgi:hypothetical protein
MILSIRRNHFVIWAHRIPFNIANKPIKPTPKSGAAYGGVHGGCAAVNRGADCVSTAITPEIILYFSHTSP